MESVLDIIFPKTCSICSRKGTYLCSECKKFFKKTLPECYVCRRISKNYNTHDFCKGSNRLNRIFVCWEYNSLTSGLLRKYKYGYVYDIDNILSGFVVERIGETNFIGTLKDSLLINIPISSSRLNERGFNQTYNVTRKISETFNLRFSEHLIGRKHSFEHQAFKDKDERLYMSEDEFFLLERKDAQNFNSITIVDDVITTGSTLEAATLYLRKEFGEKLIVNAICIFRGRPFYSATDPKLKSGDNGLDFSSEDSS